MADILDVTLSVVSTLTIQGAYFVLLKYPEKLTIEKLAIETEHRKMQHQFADEADSLQFFQEAMMRLAGLCDGLYKGMAPVDVEKLRTDLATTLAKMNGLEVLEQPMASHVAKHIAVLSRATEYLKTWQGAQDSQAAFEFSMKIKTLLISALAVKRANDNNLSAFWLQMKQRQAALGSLVQTFLASAIALEVVTVFLLAMGAHALVEHKLLARWVGWFAWLASSLLASWGLHRILRFIWPVNALVQSINQSSDAALLQHSPKFPVEPNGANVSIETTQG